MRSDNMVSQFNSPMKHVITEEQFSQVVEAILNGKYSWACLLILRFSGYNPLHYMPYRTYNRLIKENRLGEKNHSSKQKTSSPEKSFSRESLTVVNLPHLQPAEDCSTQIKGGFLDAKDSAFIWLKCYL